MHLLPIYVNQHSFPVNEMNQVQIRMMNMTSHDII